METIFGYPSADLDRTRWINENRKSVGRSLPDDWDVNRPIGFLSEEEPNRKTNPVSTATIFLANSQCPWRCLMCDLWRNTLPRKVPRGAIPRQIEYALSHLPAVSEIKLYNAGSFFDPRAIPREDHPAIARLLSGFKRVVVECHPALVEDEVLKFRDLLSGRLEVAMGLETVHPTVGPMLNKRMPLDLFRRAADFLFQNKIDLRVFVLLQPPFLPPEEAVEWALQSVDFSWKCAARLAVVIPTREGNGAMELLARQGHFVRPKLSALESTLDQALEKSPGLVMADLWDLDRFSSCEICFEPRKKRLEAMNLTQKHLAAAGCPVCHGQS